MRFLILSNLSSIGAAFLLGARFSEACWGGLPDRVLKTPDEFLLTAPDADFVEELRRIADPPEFHYRIRPEESGFEATRSAEAEDLRLRLLELEATEPVIEATVRQVKSVRSVEGEIGPLQGLDLPLEFQRYLEGARHYHTGAWDRAEVAWKALLAQPAEVRRYRSTWAAFMLGKLKLHQDRYDEAVAYFDLVRVQARLGFFDTLGLASTSLGWQGRIERLSDRPSAAAAWYLKQAVLGDPDGAASLGLMAREILQTGHVEQVEAARDHRLRQIVTAYLVSRRGVGDRARRWLYAVESTGEASLPGADRMAWLAYRAGVFGLAARWIRVAPDTVVRRWISIKLHLLHGKVQPAADGLKSLVDKLKIYGTDPDEYQGRSGASTRALGLRVRGELAVLELSRRDFESALDLLIRGGYWLDGAYLAERILTLPELKAYVDRAWSSPNPSEASSVRIRYLLGRRLVRVGRLDEALVYLPEKMRPKLLAYQEALRSGRSWWRLSESRAFHLFRAARIVRRDGMELMGTEAWPDWSAWSGRFSTEGLADLRSTMNFRPPFSSTDEELKRAIRPAPNQRFHYRYVAAGLALEGAELLPASSEDAAIMLCWATRWHLGRDPDFARKFYREFLYRNHLFQWSSRFGQECPEPGSNRRSK